jgi:glucokinase
MPINYNGPKCVCGNHGCLERYVGSRYIIRLFEKLSKNRKRSTRHRSLTVKAIAQKAKKGDRIAAEVFAEIGYYIGIGVANVITLLDPEIVIIAGGISRAGKILFDPIRRTVRDRLVGAQHRRYRIVPAMLGDDAGIMGAIHYLKTVIRKQ